MRRLQSPTSTTSTAISPGSPATDRCGRPDRRDVRAGASALAPIRPRTRLRPDLALPGRTDGRARPFPLRAPPHAARAARRATRTLRGALHRGAVTRARGSRRHPDRRRARGDRAARRARRRRDDRIARARHLRHELHHAAQPRAQEARGGPPCRSVTSSPSCTRARIAAPVERARAGSPDRRQPPRPARRRFTWRRALVVAVPVRRGRRRRGDPARPAPSRPRRRPRPSSSQARPRRAKRRRPPCRDRARRPAQRDPHRARRHRVASSALRRAPVAACRDAERRLERRQARAAHRDRRSAAIPTSCTRRRRARTRIADLVLRIPRRTSRSAISRLSQLGTITGEQVDVQDLPGAARHDRLARSRGCRSSSRPFARRQQTDPCRAQIAA